MRLLILTQIIDQSDPGLGFFHRWVEVFSEECESIEVICLKRGKYSFPSNVTVTSLGKEDGVSRLKYLWRFYTTIWKKRHHYDAVFVHMNPEYVVLGGILWRLMGKRIGLWYTHRTVDMKLRIAAHLMHRAFTGSKESFRIDSPKVIVTGQGVDTSLFTPPAVEHDGPPVLVVVGRISPVKNLELAIDTIDMVRRDYHDATLRIVGAIGKSEDQAYLDALHADISKRCLNMNVIVVGGKDPRGVLEELRNADIFLHTSMTNSADKTAVEAMAVGVYPITSSPVYRKDLPESCFQEPTPEAYGAEIRRYLSLGVVERVRLQTVLREAAVREHSLERLIRHIVSYLQV